MKLKELVKTLPGYTMVHVHDDGSNNNHFFACQGNPHQFVSGVYKSHGEDLVKVAIPIRPYHMEVIVQEANNNAPMA